MPDTKSVDVASLNLDLANFRMPPQLTELQTVQSMVGLSPNRFWALVDSLLDDGYLPTESILVLRSAGGSNVLTVKEGNRRIAALKLIHGLISPSQLTIPANITSRIASVSSQWKQDNAQVPCTIYDAQDASKVDRIISLAHGKGEMASRDQWTAVARARHLRDMNGVQEYGLDLLEKYLKNGKTLNGRNRSAGCLGQ